MVFIFQTQTAALFAFLLINASSGFCAETIRVSAVGDVMMGSWTPEPAAVPAHPKQLLKSVRGALNGDIVLANLEGPLTDVCEPSKCSPASRERKSCFEFQTPSSFTAVLTWAGFNAAGLNNNHAMDCGTVGFHTTTAALQGAGIRYAGTKKQIAEFHVAGTTVGVAAFGFSDRKEFPSILKIEESRSFVRELSRRYPVLIVTFHGGAEGEGAWNMPEGIETFAGEERGDLRVFARAMIDAGADLVIGHGPHVPRAMELYQGRLIAYSLGNFFTFGKMNMKGMRAYAPVLKTELEMDGTFKKGAVVSFLQKDMGGLSADPRRLAAKTIQKLSREHFPDSPLRIKNSGELTIKN